MFVLILELDKGVSEPIAYRTVPLEYVVLRELIGTGGRINTV